VFGEMVDLLAQRGQIDAALALEQLWNALASERDFSLLCGYELDVFDVATQVGALPEICGLHSHVRPTHDPLRLSRAVDLALEQVLGATQAGKVYVVIGDELRADRVPAPQLVMMWVSANMPHSAERILAAARARYAELPPSHAPQTTTSANTRGGIDRGWGAALRKATRARPQPLFWHTD